MVVAISAFRRHGRWGPSGQGHLVRAVTAEFVGSGQSLKPSVSQGRGRLRVVCHESSRSKRLRATVREMKEGPSGSAIRSPIPSHRELLRSKAEVVSVTETSGL